MQTGVHAVMASPMSCVRKLRSHGGGEGDCGLLSLPLRMQDDSSCLYKYDFKAKAFPHLVHMCGFVLEWVCTWARKFDLSAKALLHTGHLNGFSPTQINIQINILLILSVCVCVVSTCWVYGFFSFSLSKTITVNIKLLNL